LTINLVSYSILVSCITGDILTRLSEQDDMGWVKARSKDGKEGLIPYGYIEDI